MARVKYYDQASQEWKYADAALNMKGKDGYTPQKGIDYFTEEDVQELTENVIDQGVLTYNEQSLTEEQKAQARQNIGIDRISMDKLTENLNADGFRITNLPLPESGSEPATKEFVENFTIPTGGNIEIEFEGESTGICEPQNPLYHKEKDAYFYPLTSEKQIVMDNGERLSGTNFLTIDKHEAAEGEPAPINAQQLDGRPAKDYATQTFVLAEIAKAQLDGSEGEVNFDAFATKDEIPTRVSQLQNDVGYLNSSALDSVMDEMREYLDQVIIEGEW